MTNEVNRKDEGGRRKCLEQKFCSVSGFKLDTRLYRSREEKLSFQGYGKGVRGTPTVKLFIFSLQICPCPSSSS